VGFAKTGIPVLLVAALLAGGTRFLSAAPWQAGFARAKITPAESLMFGGYAARQKPFVRVEQDIFVKALALNDENGNRAILLSCDLLGLRAELAKLAIEGVATQTGLGRENILLASSHAHTGPSASAIAGALLSEAEAAKLEKYHGWLKEQIVATASAALRDLSPAEISSGSGLALLVVNRREPTPQGIRSIGAIDARLDSASPSVSQKCHPLSGAA
jgi:hypothetical protein